MCVCRKEFDRREVKKAIDKLKCSNGWNNCKKKIKILRNSCEMDVSDI